MSRYLLGCVTVLVLLVGAETVAYLRWRARWA